MRMRSDAEAFDDDGLSPMIAAQMDSGWNCAPKHRPFLGEFIRDAFEAQRAKPEKRKRRRKR